MKKRTIFFLVFLSSNILAWGQELLNETLRDGSLPTGWSETDIDFRTADGGYARFQSLNSELTTSSFSADGYSSVIIDFWTAKYGTGGDGPLTLEYSLDGGENWQSAGESSTPISATYINDNIEIDETSSDMVIRFTRSGSPSQKRLRDIVITGSGTPNFGDCGVESFDNFTITGSSYATGNFTGDDHFVWYYDQCRGDAEITGKSITIGQDRNPQSRFYADEIPGGIGILNFDYMQAFSTNVDLDVWVNGVVVDNVTSDSEENVIKNSGDIVINLPGDFDLEFKNRINGGGQVTVDNITWTCFECNMPTLSADQPQAANITFSEADISWNKGNGTHTLVLVKEGSGVDAQPADDTSYQAESAFGEGDELGTGNFAVYAGDGNDFILEGLQGGTTYHVAMFSYNCSDGNEKYLITDPATLSFTTPPASASNLQITCTDNNSATVVWDNPSGNFDGVIIGVRQGNNPPHSLNSDAPEDLDANSNFGDGYEYGGSDPKSYIVYNGAGNTVTIDFSIDESPYVVMAYTYHGTTWANATPTRTIQQLGVPDVDNFLASPNNLAAELVWTNPEASCFDDIIIVAHTASISGVPVGTYVASSPDFSDTGNPDFPDGGKVVYNGIQSSQTITGFTNGQQYHFKIFIRRGSDWSTGIETSVVPVSVTMLEETDLGVLGINTNTGSGNDEIIFAILQEFTTNSSIDFTDNGYEREVAGFWGTTEGVIRLVRTGGDLSAGTVVTLQGKDGGANPQLGTHFSVFLGETNDNDNWDLLSLNGSSSFNLGNSDQLWIMQGGSWSVSQGTHRGVYTGNVLYGWSSTGWNPQPGYNSTSGSTLYPGSECINVDVNALTDSEKVKYTGDTSSSSPTEWIRRINDFSNWTGYTDDESYESGGTFEDVLAIETIAPEDTKWIGDEGTDWFDCHNWSSLKVPDENTDVVMDHSTTQNIVIKGSGQAAARNLMLQSSSHSLILDDSGSDLVISGDLVINSGSTLNMVNGMITISGNFTQQGNFTHQTGLVFFNGISTQTLQLDEEVNFENITFDNPSGVVLTGNDLNVLGELGLEDGFIDAGEHEVYFQNADTDAFSLAPDTYIKGVLRRKVSETGLYKFPVGDASHPQTASVQINSSSNLNDIVVSFHDNLNTEDLDISDLNLNVFDSRLNTLLDAGFWTIEANSGSTVDYDLTLEIFAGNMGDDPGQHSIVKRDDGDSDWELQGEHDNDTQSENEGILTVVRSGLTGFSDFAVAKNDVGPLPVELLYFQADSHAEDDLVELTWATATETNNDFFTIERSGNTIQSEIIGSVNGAGNSSEIISYRFTDHEPLPGLNYYRLKQTDYDGSFEYTSWQAVQVSTSREDALQITNITRENQSIVLHIQNPKEDDLYVYVHDAMGRKVYSGRIHSAGKGYLLHTIDHLQERGMLIITVVSSRDRLFEKIVY